MPEEKQSKALTAGEQKHLNAVYRECARRLEAFAEVVPPAVGGLGKVRVELVRWAGEKTLFGGNWAEGQRPFSVFVRTLARLNEIVDSHSLALDVGLCSWVQAASNWHPVLAREINSLVESKEWDTAIRKAFVTLSASLKCLHPANRDLDGNELVQACFGGQSPQVSLPNLEPGHVVRFLGGFYILFRNQHAHYQRPAEYAEVQAILSMVNWVMLAVDAANAP